MYPTLNCNGMTRVDQICRNISQFHELRKTQTSSVGSFSSNRIRLSTSLLNRILVLPALDWVIFPAAREEAVVAVFFLQWLLAMGGDAVFATAETEDTEAAVAIDESAAAPYNTSVTTGCAATVAMASSSGWRLDAEETVHVVCVAADEQSPSSG